MNIAFIPARGGSKSIPLKNIKPLNGKPLIYWTALAAQNAACINKLIIATDSDKIAETVTNFNFTKLEIYHREAENAKDSSSTESVILEYINKSNLSPNDNFFLIQATSPLLNSIHIDSMYEKYITSGADSIFSGVIEKQFHWYLPKADENTVTPVNYDYRNRPRRQEFEGLIAENGACYINKVKNILKYKCRLSGNITFYELPEYTAFEIDESQDWIIVESLMNRFYPFQN